jgi:demethylmenaquinone methyltransferase / 2-methoxy-6-polyprenyl-1,4-benzoquinol methylase
MPPAPSQESPLSPHPHFTDHYASADEKREWLRSIFDDTAADYDRVESWLALGSGRWYRRQALLRAGLKPGMHVCDVACGTGLVAREALAIVGGPPLRPRGGSGAGGPPLRPRGGSVLGVDPSPGMLARATSALPSLNSAPGRAESIPAGDSTFDFLSMGYALRHVEDLSIAFAEYHRVLKPGGTVCILEITSPDSGAGRFFLKAYMRLISTIFCRLPRVLGGSTSRRTSDLWRYYWDTIDRCVRPEKVLDALRAAGFVDVKRNVQLGVFSEYTGRKG